MTAVAVPEDPGVEWGGITACAHERVVFDRSLCACGTMHYYCLDCVGDPLDSCAFRAEVAYHDRSPREEWVGAWQQHRETHR